MEFQHELIIPNEGLPFKVFLFEGGNGNYVREKHWHTSVEIFAVMEGRLDFFQFSARNTHDIIYEAKKPVSYPPAPPAPENGYISGQ